MQAAHFFLLPMVLLSACQPTSTNPPDQTRPLPRVQSNTLVLTADQKAQIGKMIWNNESGGKISGLTHWNDGEEFPSLGIGHFIWYPKGFHGRWTETWPEFIQYATQRGVLVPKIALEKECPWPNRAAFTRDFDQPQLTGLRNWLAANIGIQTEFIAEKSRSALPNMMRAVPAAQRQRVYHNYQKVATTPNGIYALVDYVNFKGDGTNPRESYAGQGWGLMWVLMEMGPTSAGQAAAQEFAAAAKRRLDLRIQNSPKARGESRWREGWHRRCETYAQPVS
jgi:hypothetical protein